MSRYLATADEEVLAELKKQTAILENTEKLLAAILFHLNYQIASWYKHDRTELTPKEHDELTLRFCAVDLSSSLPLTTREVKQCNELNP